MSNLIDQASLVMIPSGYKEDKIYSQVPTDGSGDLTFTRASDGTRVNSQGLVERVPWNLLQQSNTFSTTWTALNGGAVTSGQSGYDGTNNAWSLSKTAANGEIRQTVLSGLRTFSVYAKAGSLNWLYLLKGGNAGQFFNLGTGQVGTGNAQVISANIQSVGGGWYLCSMVYNDAYDGSLRIYPADADNDTSGTSGNIYIQDAQLNEGSTAKPYFPTTDRLNVPRLDYSGGCPSLLLEPQRTNYFEYSEDYSQIDWTKASLTVVSNAATSPDGYQNADKIYPSATGGFSYLYNISSTSSSVHTISAYVKADGKNIVWLYIQGGATYGTIYFDLSDQSIQVVGGSVSTPSGTITAVGSDWYRITFTTGSALAVTLGSGIGISDAKGNTYVTASGTNGVLVWGAQLEQGSYATSYIPTTSASVTRVADEASKTGISSLIGQSEGTIFVEFDQSLIGQSATRRIFALSDGTTNNRITAYINSGNKIDFYVRNSGGDLFLGTASTAGNTKGVHKIAAVYKDQDYAVYFDGSSIISGTGTAGTIPACSRFDLANQLGANDLYEPINQALLFKTRLTNAELAALTTL